AAGDDVAAELGERRRHALGLLVAKRPRLRACGSEDGDAISLASRWPQTREVVDHVPESQDRRGDDVSDAILVVQAHRSLAVPKFLLHTPPALTCRNPAGYQKLAPGATSGSRQRDRCLEREITRRCSRAHGVGA